jgi:hypothetical protein
MPRMTGQLTTEYKRARDATRKREDRQAKLLKRHERRMAQHKAAASMAEVERKQIGETKRTKMVEAGKEKSYKAGGYTSPQMANLRKSAFASADSEITRRREEGGLFYGSGDNTVEMTPKQIAEERNLLAKQYLQEYMGGEVSPETMQQKPEAVSPQGVGRVIAPESGRRWDVSGGEVTESSTAPPQSAMAGQAGQHPISAVGWQPSTFSNVSSQPPGAQPFTRDRKPYLSQFNKLQRSETIQPLMRDLETMGKWTNRYGLQPLTKTAKYFGGNISKFGKHLLKGQEEARHRLPGYRGY